MPVTYTSFGQGNDLGSGEGGGGGGGGGVGGRALGKVWVRLLC